MNKKNFFKKGQALLIVLLSMAVVLIIVLSILAKSITDISVTSQDEDSLRAFSAAEAGVERALILGSGQESGSLQNATYSFGISSFAEGKTEFSYPSSLFSGESAYLWFVSHDSEGNLVCNDDNTCFTGSSIITCWGSEGLDSESLTAPAMEMLIFYTSTPGNYATTKIKRVAIDPNDTRKVSNNFADIGIQSCSVEGKTYSFGQEIDFASLGIENYDTPNVLQFALVRMLYNTDLLSPIAFSAPSGSLFPSQGLKVDSSGTSGDANRKVEVYKFFSQVPEIFQFGLYSGGYIQK